MAHGQVRRIVYTAQDSGLTAMVPQIPDLAFDVVGIRHLSEIHDGPRHAPKILLLEEQILAGVGSQGIIHDLRAFCDNAGVVVVVGENGTGAPGGCEVPEELISAHLPLPSSGTRLAPVLRSSFKYLESQLDLLKANEQLAVFSRELKELNRIGIALSAERDLDRLLSLILRKSREITSADAGSLYLVEAREDGIDRLRFKLSQCDSLDVGYEEYTMPLSQASIAGCAALSGQIVNIADVYQLPPGSPYRFDPSWDKKSGYHTRSMLVVPMKNRSNAVIGVVQLINRKRHQEVIAFDSWSEELVISMASQAGVAIENNVLNNSIQNLFEGFVQASVTAIESRDPTTSGHSSRVAALTVGLAEVVDGLTSGPFREIRFSREQLKEIRYASLLHDFGKVAVREEVLVKAKKLYPYRLDLIRARFDYARCALKGEYSERKLALALELGREAYMAQVGSLEARQREELEELERFLELIFKANEPTVLDDGNFEALKAIGERTYLDLDGQQNPLLLPDEMGFLSIRRGTLDAEERQEIESHVVHTYRFLTQIPWTSELKRVPQIAHAHHEKLDGSGYPVRLSAGEIPVQSKMMAISDIYDALTASDRPYKKALPLEKALDILGFEAKDRHIDRELLDLFIEHKVYALTQNN